MKKVIVLVGLGAIGLVVTTIAIFSNLQSGAPRFAAAQPAVIPSSPVAAPPAAAGGIQPVATALPDQPIGPATPPQTEAGSAQYLPYTAEALAANPERRRVLFFYANWCPTCRAADADLSAKLDQLPADLTVIRVNYNDNQTDAAARELARQYGVTYQHTFVQIDATGQELTKWNGGQVAELNSRLQ